MAIIHPSNIIPVAARKTILASAIVSTYNSERFLRGCLEDLTRQTLFIKKELEIIVIDSGSPQNEKIIVSEFQERFPDKIHYIRTERESLYAAWNRAIEAAMGKYLTNANTDDRHRSDALELLCKTLDDNPDIDLVYGDCYVSSIENETFEENAKTILYRYPRFFPPSALIHYQFGPQPVWRRVVHDKIGLFDSTYRAAGDYDFNLRFALTCKALHVSEPLGLYLKHPSAITYRDNTMALENERIAKKYRVPETVLALYKAAGVPCASPEEQGTVLLDMGIRAIEYYPPWKPGQVARNPEFAAECFLCAAELVPGWSAPLNNLAVVFFLNGNQIQALEILNMISAQERNETVRKNIDGLMTKPSGIDLILIPSELSLPSERELREGTTTATQPAYNQAFLNKQREFWNVDSMFDAMFERVVTDKNIRSMTPAEKLAAWNGSIETSISHILQGIPSQPLWKVLEIGCGVGRLVKPLRDRFCQVDGVDIAENMITFAKQYLADGKQNGNLYLNNGADLSELSDSFYDFVYSMIVFQHIRSASVVMSYFRETYRVLRPGGYFRLQVTHADVKGMGSFNEEAEADEQYGFLGNGYTPDQLAKMLEDAGFMVVEITEDGKWLWATVQKQATSSAHSRTAKSTCSPASQSLGNSRNKVIKQKILFVCHDFPPYRYAGAQLYAMNLAKELNRSGHVEVDILHPVFRDSYERYEILEDKFEGLRVFKLTKETTIGFEQSVRHPEVVRLVDKFLSEGSYDIIHIHSLGQLSGAPIEAANKHGIPIILTLHDHWFMCYYWFLVTPAQEICSGPESVEKCAQCFCRFTSFTAPKQQVYPTVARFMELRFSYLRQMFDLAAKRFAPSRYLAEKFAAFGFDGIEVSPLGLSPCVALPKPKKSRVVFGYIGQVQRAKGVDLLVDVFSQITSDQASLVIYGKSFDDDYLQQICAITDKYENMQYKGAYTPQMLPQIMSEIDVAIFPTFSESFSLVIREAYMNNTPVIASNIGAIPEIVSDGINGLLFEAGNKAGLHAALKRVINSPHLIEEYRRNIPPIKTIAEDAAFYTKLYTELTVGHHNKPDSKTHRILFYFFKNVHIPILKPIYEACKRLYPKAKVGFACMPYAPEMRAGFLPEEMEIIHAIGEKVYPTPQEFRPDITFIADSVYPWVQGCGKLVHVGHGVLSKGQYYTDTDIARREEQADLVCVPGFHHAAVMKGIISKPVIATGMAKLDPLFSGKITRETECVRLNLPPHFRYILFAPTFNDELSAIPFVHERIVEVIPDDRTVLLIKLHGSTKQENKQMYRRLGETHPHVHYCDDLDITPFLAIADVMISDVSSSMMEFAALDKPLVLFNNPLWATYPNYNPSDIEFQWRDIGVQVNDLEEMRQAIARSFENPGEFSDKRRYYTEQLFANKRQGNGAERILATAIGMFGGSET